MNRRAATRPSTLACLRRLAAALVLVAASGCAARYVRLEEKGLTCIEAQHIAMQAVARMGYTISETTKATPTAPGIIVGSREEGLDKHGIFVQVFCTTQGAEVEAKSDQGGLTELSFANDFRRSFESVSANRLPPRPAAENGVDVLLTQEHAVAGIDADLTTLGILPISVRITNHTTRDYRFRAAGVLLQTDGGERVAHLSVAKVTTQLATNAAAAVHKQALEEGTIAPNETLTGLLFFPFKAYARARVELIDRASNETEGFTIEF